MIAWRPFANINNQAQVYRKTGMITEKKKSISTYSESTYQTRKDLALTLRRILITPPPHLLIILDQS